MDELKIKSSLMRKLLTKVITKLIRKKYGYNIYIQLNDLDIKVVNGRVHLHTDVDLEIDTDEFKEIVKNITED